MKLVDLAVLVLGILGFAPQAHGQTYESVSLDSAGQLSIEQRSGTAFDAPKLRDQVSFSQPLLTPDHRTVAWLADYANPSDPSGSAGTIPGCLVLYGAGHVLRLYRTDQVFWSWQFAHRGKDVAFCTGPTHGGADTCELHRLSSGRLQAKWDPHAAGRPPEWVKGLTY